MPESYSVTLSVNGEETSLSVNENTVDLSEYSGNITITVVPVARTYNSPEPATLSFNKSKLATPSNFRFQNGTFTWSRVTGATSYMLKIGEMGDSRKRHTAHSDGRRVCGFRICRQRIGKSRRRQSDKRLQLFRNDKYRRRRAQPVLPLFQRQTGVGQRVRRHRLFGHGGRRGSAYQPERQRVCSRT